MSHLQKYRSDMTKPINVNFVLKLSLLSEPQPSGPLASRWDPTVRQSGEFLYHHLHELDGFENGRGFNDVKIHDKLYNATDFLTDLVSNRKFFRRKMSFLPTEDSVQSLSSAISYFQSPNVDVSVKSAYFDPIYPVVPLSDGSPIHFRFSSNEDYYSDMQNTILELKVKVFKSDGNPVTDNEKVSYDDCGIMNTLFQNIQIFVNDTLVLRALAVEKVKASGSNLKIMIPKLLSTARIIPTGSLSFAESSLTTYGHLLLKVILDLIKASNQLGSHESSPFKFELFHLSSLHLKVNGQPIYSLRFSGQSYRLLYEMSKRTLGGDEITFENGLSYDKWIRDSALICLDISGTPDLSVIKDVALRLYLTFSQATDASIILLIIVFQEIFSETDNSGAVFLSIQP
ncbi:hypothetical protein QYM36_008473 [Artemia franciscana]|uniref:Uncharacterized protein n=1 Tax=Artemia franciscana TaxID=6661 RepID=A0AA88LEX4_ARTSF|nr:hypothetical protein QYM36_008473 [Artemia franciscana]